MHTAAPVGQWDGGDGEIWSARMREHRSRANIAARAADERTMNRPVASVAGDDNDDDGGNEGQARCLLGAESLETWVNARPARAKVDVIRRQECF